jgi:hypothetical protein
MADYFSQTDLENALGVAIVKSAYDDDHDGTADVGPVAACIAYGNAECNSFLRNVFVAGAAFTLPLTTVPDEVKFAALEFGIAYTVRRRPDIMRAIGEQTWNVFYDAAVAKMKRYCESVQRMPPTTGDHATVGGGVLNPDSDADGEEEELPTEGRWSDMGDFS